MVVKTIITNTMVTKNSDNDLDKEVIHHKINSKYDNNFYKIVTKKSNRINTKINIKSIFKRNHILLLIIILALIFLIKLWISFSLDNLNINSYYSLYQSNQIRKTGLIDFEIHYLDNSALPITEYVLTMCSFLTNIETIAKILSALLITLMSFLVYFIVKEINSNKTIALIVSIFSAFIPILFAEFINSYTKDIFIFICYLLSTLFFLKSTSDTKYTRHFIISLIILILISPLSIIFILNFIVYFLMLSTEKIKIRMREIETFVFSLILGGWIYIILYKDAINARGLLNFLHPLIDHSDALGNIVSITSLNRNNTFYFRSYWYVFCSRREKKSTLQFYN